MTRKALQDAVGNLVDRDTWENAAKGLRGAAQAWWREHEAVIKDMAKDEIKEVAESLARGDLSEATIEIAGRMSPEEFRAFREKTTHRLEGIAATRARLLGALLSLGERSAVVVGQALLQALAPLM